MDPLEGSPCPSPWEGAHRGLDLRVDCSLQITRRTPDERGAEVAQKDLLSDKCYHAVMHPKMTDGVVSDAKVSRAYGEKRVGSHTRSAAERACISAPEPVVQPIRSDT